MSRFVCACNYWVHAGAVWLGSLALLAGCGSKGETGPASSNAPVLAQTPQTALSAPSSATTAPSGATSAWQTQVFARIEAGQYALRTHGSGLRATNPAHRLTARFERAVEVGSLDAAPAATTRLAQLAGSGTLRLKTVGLARASERLSVAGASAFQQGQCRSDGAQDELGACLKRAELQQPQYVEWWENKPAGLEQGFEIPNRPLSAAGDGALRIELAVSAARIDIDANGGGATLTSNGRTLRYDRLAARDAAGQSLAVRLVPRDGGLALEIDDRRAQYPISVDPTLGDQAWSYESESVSASYGAGIASAGDMDGDGYGDVVVGAPGYSNGQSGEGLVLFYRGSASGLSTLASWSYQPDEAGVGLGLRVAAAGDINGDGRGDVVIGAPNATNNRPSVYEGRAYVFYGAATSTGVNPTPLVLRGTVNVGFYGSTVSGAGDVNGDGFSDIIIGAVLDEHARVYKGSSTGLVTSEIWTGSIAQADAAYGTSVAGVGDVNGDGFDDIAVGAYLYDDGQTDEGAVFVYHGSSSGPSLSATRTIEIDQAGANFGENVAGAGDVQADGYADLIASAPLYHDGQVHEGGAFVFAGSASGTSTTSSRDIEGNETEGQLRFVASAGDVNGDGYGDVLVGMPLHDGGNVDQGYAALYLGSASGLSATSIWSQQGTLASENFGTVSSAGDVNNDGYSDILIGAPGYSNGQTNEGRAVAYYGGPSTLSQTASTGPGEQDLASAQFGYTVASAGDVDGDGLDDVLVGAPFYDGSLTDEGRAFLFRGTASGLATTASWQPTGGAVNASFGFKLAGVGDVNGDGYDDVLVGAPGFSNGQANEGRITGYLGGVGGLSTTAFFNIEGAQVGAQLASVAKAGDVNGDGYADVLVGAPLYDNGQADEGRVTLYTGGASGLTLSTWVKESDQAGAQFGYSVAGAGDVNRDGYGDVIIGAPFYDNGQTDEGRASVYYGSSTGLGSTPWTTESNQVSGSLGVSVASAGDVNGDGRGDLIIGVPGYNSNGSIPFQGEARVYLPTATGLSATSYTSIPGFFSNMVMGSTVASAGDVDGDGYGDILVGFSWPGSGAGGVLRLGSASGVGDQVWGQIISTPASGYGVVAGVGDVNGDGYGDVMLGIPRYSNGEADEGYAYLFLGNAGGGLSIKPQARRPNLVTPISPGARSFSSSGFDAALLAFRSPMGRTRVKLQVEAKALGADFNGSNLLTTGWVSTSNSATLLKQLVSSTPGGATPHYRVRVIYDPLRSPWFQHSRWIYGGASGQARAVHVRIAP